MSTSVAQFSHPVSADAVKALAERSASTFLRAVEPEHPVEYDTGAHEWPSGDAGKFTPQKYRQLPTVEGGGLPWGRPDCKALIQKIATESKRVRYMDFDRRPSRIPVRHCFQTVAGTDEIGEGNAAPQTEGEDLSRPGRA